jgi:hypothetical protein
MMKSNLPPPGRLTESESEESFRKDAKESTNTNGNSIRQLQICPMFDLPKTKAKNADSSSGENPSITNNPNEFCGTRVADAIDPIDGKTKTCNRTKTFDAFVHEHHLGGDQLQKPPSHIWEMTRVIAMLRSPFRQASGKADKQQNPKEAPEK